MQLLSDRQALTIAFTLERQRLASLFIYKFAFGSGQEVGQFPTAQIRNAIRKYKLSKKIIA
jgi:hypothetical protein